MLPWALGSYVSNNSHPTRLFRNSRGMVKVPNTVRSSTHVPDCGVHHKLGLMNSFYKLKFEKNRSFYKKGASGGGSGLRFKRKAWDSYWKKSTHCWLTQTLYQGRFFSAGKNSQHVNLDQLFLNMTIFPPILHRNITLGRAYLKEGRPPRWHGRQNQERERVILHPAWLSCPLIQPPSSKEGCLHSVKSPRLSPTWQVTSGTTRLRFLLPIGCDLATLGVKSPTEFPT